MRLESRNPRLSNCIWKIPSRIQRRERGMTLTLAMRMTGPTSPVSRTGKSEMTSNNMEIITWKILAWISGHQRTQEYSSSCSEQTTQARWYYWWCWCTNTIPVDDNIFQIHFKKIQTISKQRIGIKDKRSRQTQITSKRLW